MQGQLGDLQVRVLAILAPITPRWTLTGGAALAGWLAPAASHDARSRPVLRGLAAFVNEPAECIDLLQRAGVVVHVLQRTPGFVRLRADQGGDTVAVDLVAEPVRSVAASDVVTAGGASICIDSAYEILVNKLGAVLHRAELRDLVDLRALLERGADLASALADANRKDGGFSPLMLGYLLQGFPVAKQAQLAGLDEAATAALVKFRDELVVRVARFAQP